MQKTNGLNWIKLLLQLIPPIIGFVSPFIAFKLGFKNALALEEIKEINEKNKIKELVEGELKHEFEDLNIGIKAVYDNICDWNNFFTKTKEEEPLLVSVNERNLLSLEKYGVDYYCLLESDNKNSMKILLSCYKDLKLKASLLEENKEKYLQIKSTIKGVIVIIAFYKKADRKIDNDIYKSADNVLNTATYYFDSLFGCLYSLISLKGYINDLISNNEMKDELLSKKLEEELRSVGLSKKNIKSMNRNINKAFVETKFNLLKLKTV